MKHDAAEEANSSTTLPEIGDALVTPRKAHVLTLVLRFDDLLRNDQAAFHVMSE